MPPLSYTPGGGAAWASPWQMYADLRDHDPVHHVVPAERPEHDFYVLSRHEDVMAAAIDTTTFSSAQGLTVEYGELEKIGLTDNPPMVMLDPPDHTAFRKLVARGFTPRAVREIEPDVRAYVVARLDDLAARGEGDIVVELFKPLPSMVVAHYLGRAGRRPRPFRRLDRRDRCRQLHGLDDGRRGWTRCRGGRGHDGDARLLRRAHRTAARRARATTPSRTWWPPTSTCCRSWPTSSRWSPVATTPRPATSAVLCSCWPSIPTNAPSSRPTLA